MRATIETLWPSFLIAGVAEGVFFTFFDPMELHFLGEPIEAGCTAVYSIGFFIFWLMTSASSTLTKWLQAR
ncbi:MAG: hypothetical protein EXR36_11115 [Betaproteobacteria bacterium]|nr:hypothetical protein [Betaproteobacteria bacterium]